VGNGHLIRLYKILKLPEAARQGSLCLLGSINRQSASFEAGDFSYCPEKIFAEEKNRQPPGGTAPGRMKKEK